jgi:hypothetical protein
MACAEVAKANAKPAMAMSLIMIVLCYKEALATFQTAECPPGHSRSERGTKGKPSQQGIPTPADSTTIDLDQTENDNPCGTGLPHPSDAAAQHAIPTIAGSHDFAAAGGLMT